MEPEMYVPYAQHLVEERRAAWIGVMFGLALGLFIGSLAACLAFALTLP